MTLRTRLTVAFVAAVLGPALLGAGLVVHTARGQSEERAVRELTVAATVVRTALTARCDQLRASAALLAAQPTNQRAQLATQLVTHELASVVQIRSPQRWAQVTDGSPPRRWADCAADDLTSVRYGALAAQAPLAAGGAVWVATPVDAQTVHELAHLAGVEVTLLGAGPTDPLHSSAPVPSEVVAAAADVAPGEIGRTDSRYVLRLAPERGAPLPLLLSVPRPAPSGPPPAAVILVTAAIVAAVAMAGWLGRGATRPLRELSRAADRLAAGELTTRVPIRTRDEAGQLAAAFNRMAQRTQGHVRALRAGREQLRQQLTVLGNILSSTHDLDRLLRVVLHTAQATTGARAGAVMLIDRSTRTLVGQATAPGDRSPADQLIPIRVPLGEGLLGGVAVAGAAQRGRIGPAGPVPHPEEPDCRTYLLVPITAPAGGTVPPAPWPAPPSVRGVLAVYDRFGGDDFDDHDLAALQILAGRVGAAVDNVRMHQETQRLSLTDPLTGLWNYRHLRTALRREVERANRFHHPLAVLLLDLDRFKSVNDRHGHAAGDAVLVEFAARVRSMIREVDVPFRHGGEEFVLLLPETDTRGATVLAQRLGAAVRSTPVVIGTRGDGAGRIGITVTVSIGIAVYPTHGRHPEALLEAADDALYRAKADGRDTYRVAAPVEPEPSDRPDQPGPLTEADTQELPIRGDARTPEDALPRAGAHQPGPVSPAGGELRQGPGSEG
ncbi:MAG TPA: diguanylate cyclase [Natronosporangium sp.]|nr:diguanylate cyclase [Natronosporangium sp.]